MGSLAVLCVGFLGVALCRVRGGGSTVQQHQILSIVTFFTADRGRSFDTSYIHSTLNNSTTRISVLPMDDRLICFNNIVGKEYYASCAMVDSFSLFWLFDECSSLASSQSGLLRGIKHSSFFCYFPFAPAFPLLKSSILPLANIRTHTRTNRGSRQRAVCALNGMYMYRVRG